jgi:hypothetical protein
MGGIIVKMEEEEGNLCLRLGVRNGLGMADFTVPVVPENIQN